MLSDEDAEVFIEIIDRVCSSWTSSSGAWLTVPLNMKAFRAARLKPELQNITLAVLRILCGRIGCLPNSYLLPRRFDLSGTPRAFGGFADIRAGVFKGKDVAIKSLRVPEVDEKITIRKV